MSKTPILDELLYSCSPTAKKSIKDENYIPKDTIDLVPGYNQLDCRGDHKFESVQNIVNIIYTAIDDVDTLVYEMYCLKESCITSVKDEVMYRLAYTFADKQFYKKVVLLVIPQNRCVLQDIAQLFIDPLTEDFKSKYPHVTLYIAVTTTDSLSPFAKNIVTIKDLDDIKSVNLVEDISKPKEYIPLISVYKNMLNVIIPESGSIKSTPDEIVDNIKEQMRLTWYDENDDSIDFEIIHEKTIDDIFGHFPTIIKNYYDNKESKQNLFVLTDKIGSDLLDLIRVLKRLIALFIESEFDLTVYLIISIDQYLSTGHKIGNCSMLTYNE